MKKLILPLALVSMGSIHAATITWTTGPTTITDDSDIDLTGTLMYATTWGGATTTVGTTTFVAGDNADAAVTKAGQNANNDYFASAGTTVTAPFETVLDSFAYDGANPKVLTLNGLTIGDMYQIQLFVSDDRTCCGGRTQLWSDNATMGSGNETATFAHSDSPYVIGTFTAMAMTENVYGHGVAQGQTLLNAIVLRDITPVPEPSTSLLGALAAIALLRRRR